MDQRQGDPNNHGFGSIVEACRSFARCYLAFLRRDRGTRAGIKELILQSDRDDVDELERESIYATIAQALFPDLCEAADDWSSDDSAGPLADEAAAAAEAMDAEEATFAARLAEAMKAKGVTQSALASQIGVQQPAISMMLSRQCRPQRRTVERLAEALCVEPSALWPQYPDYASPGARASSIPNGAG